MEKRCLLRPGAVCHERRARANVRVGDFVVVVGLGAIGQMPFNWLNVLARRW